MDIGQDGLSFEDDEACRNVTVIAWVPTDKGWEKITLEADEALIRLQDGWLAFKPTKFSSEMVALEEMADRVLGKEES